MPLPAPWTRRDFLKTTAAVTGAGLLAPCPGVFGQDRAARSLRLLILGGTGFLGPHTVEAAVRRGHEMTLFNRGRTNPHLFPDLEKLKGDRDGQLDALRGREWDAVIDTSGYFPRIVKDSAELLAPNVGQYVFISSVSVYAKFPAEDVDESSPVGTIDDPTMEQITAVSYGPLKALCEQAAEAAFPGRTTNIRPGYIVGPRDRSDRFTYWPVRVDRGGDMVAPGKPEFTVQVIDVRDLAEWIIHVIERRTHGVFNADGVPLRMDRLLRTCKSVSGSDARFTWVEAEFLKNWFEENNHAQWRALPIWSPPPDGDESTEVSVAKARGAGLKLRPIADTVRATLKWHKAEREGQRIRTGLPPEQEQELLSAWYTHIGKQAEL